MGLKTISIVLIVKLIDLNFFVTILSALGLIFFYKNMDSVLKMFLSIEYHTKSDPPLVTLAKMFSIQGKSTLKRINIDERPQFLITLVMNSRWNFSAQAKL